MGAFVHYLDTPVGPYAEVLASPAVLLRGGLLAAAHIPFIAVDSEASVRGGRENWALPKTLARFAFAGGRFGRRGRTGRCARRWRRAGRGSRSRARRATSRSRTTAPS